MLILHAAFCRDQFFLWGESPIPDDSPKKEDDRFPFEAQPSQFPKADVLGFKCTKTKFREMLLWCPGRGKSVFASSPLIASEPVAKSAVSLSAWSIQAIPLDMETAISLFMGIEGRHMLAPGVVVAPDLAFAVQTFRLAGSLVVAQHYLPGLQDEDEGWFARWMPIISGEYQQQLAQAVADMPASIRALTDPQAKQAPQQAPREKLTGMLTLMLDHLVRKASTVKNKRSFASIHDRWLHALQSADGHMDTASATASELAARISDWRRPMALAANSPLRLCFRLEEPEIPETDEPGLFQDWYVRYFLQAHADPSLLIGADDVWAEKDLPKLLQGKVRFRETLLSFLGQAAGICEQVTESLEGKAPGGYLLSNDGAFTFLSEKAAILKQFGFSVLLPTWWGGKGAQAKLSVKAKATAPAFTASSGMSLKTVVQFRPELALNGESLTSSELEMLAGLKVSLVRLRGQWVEIGETQIRQALAFLKKQAESSLTLGELIRLKIGAEEVEDGLFLEQIVADGWLGELLERLDHSEMEICARPETFVGALRPYQERGFSWLAFLTQWGLGACLADDMGLGKTVQTLSLLLRDKELGCTLPALLVCPVSVVDNWQKEAHRFTPDLKVHIHHGPERLKSKQFRQAADSVNLVITSFGLMQRDLRTLSSVSWRGIILDEAQNIKNANTKQAKAARSLDGQYRIALTGTPVENNVGDLWSISEFLNPGLLGSQQAFKKNFFAPIQASQDRKVASRLKKITGPFILRRLKTDKTIIDDLPEKVEIATWCALTREQTTLYAAVLKDLQNKLEEEEEGIARRGLVLALLTALKQVCNHPAQFLGDGSAHAGRSGKLIRLEEILEEVVSVGEKALIFTQYAKMGFILQQRLQEVFGREMPFLHGAVAKKKRDAMVARFQDSGEDLPVLILSLKAGGTGLNLTEASHVIHFDRWWNPAVEDQATDRAFRIGQKRNVTVHKFVCSGTVEDRINEMIELKRQVAGAVVGTGEAWLTELSNEELRQAFALTAVPMED